MLTLVLEVMSRCGENLQWTSKVEQVKLGVESEEHVNGLLVNHSGSLIRSHLDGIDSWRGGGGSHARGVWGSKCNWQRADSEELKLEKQDCKL